MNFQAVDGGLLLMGCKGEVDVWNKRNSQKKRGLGKVKHLVNRKETV